MARLNGGSMSKKSIIMKLDEDWLGWNYIGFAAAVLSVIVTAYNINQYWKKISQKGDE